jgi:hypothetical protein
MRTGLELLVFCPDCAEREFGLAGSDAGLLHSEDALAA